MRIAQGDYRTLRIVLEQARSPHELVPPQDPLTIGMCGARSAGRRPVKDGLLAPVLVLNRNFLPIRVTNARDAFGLLYCGRARALDDDFETYDFIRWSARKPTAKDAHVRTLRGPVRVPRLIVLAGYSRLPRVSVRLSRKNVFLRDAYTCQYCERRLPARELNLDHVVPRSRGGRSSWDNLVTSCRDCNRRKGGELLHESGLELRRKPFRPSWAVVVQTEAAGGFSEWAPFLGAEAGRRACGA